jgi:hypothetical protein
MAKEVDGPGAGGVSTLELAVLLFALAFAAAGEPAFELVPPGGVLQAEADSIIDAIRRIGSDCRRFFKI